MIKVITDKLRRWIHDGELPEERIAKRPPSETWQVEVIYVDEKGDLKKKISPPIRDSDYGHKWDGFYPYYRAETLARDKARSIINNGVIVGKEGNLEVHYGPHAVMGVKVSRVEEVEPT